MWSVSWVWGGIFLRRDRAPKAEIINDLNGEVANFFRILQRHYVPFMEMMRFQITTRRAFDRLKSTDPETLTDLERAARFLYLQRIAFGGKVDGQNFGVTRDRTSRFDIMKLAPDLEALHERLSGVVIECLEYSDLIKRYDHPGALFYLDPPYYGSEDYYGKALFSRDEYEAMAAQLKDIKGTFILSINDVPEIRQTFRAFHISEVSTGYTLAATGSKKTAELIISGHKIAEKKEIGLAS